MMRVLQTAALCASAFVTVLAQSANLAFTSTPSSVEAGKTITIKYSAENINKPVTILLRKGDPSDLSTVAILTSSTIGGSYQWTPSDSLVDGDDYALEILQDEDSNYTGEFSLSGGTKSSSKSSSASGYVTSSSSSSSSSHVSTGLPVVSSNLTANATTHASGASSSAGTGIPMTRNTTLVSATLSATTSSSQSSSTGSGSGAGYEGTSTGASAPATHTGAAMSNMVTSSPLALVICAIAAILY